MAQVWLDIGCMDIVLLGLWIWGGMLNCDSYRFKQTLKEQGWWSNQYLLPPPPFMEQGYFNRGLGALTFSNGK